MANNSLFRIRQREPSGATLIEIVVAVGILGVLTVVAATLFLSIMQGQLSVRADVAAIEGLRTAVESMSREIRAGRGYRFNDPTYGAESIAFTRTLDTGADTIVVYRRNTTDNSLERSGNGGTEYGKITSATVSVLGLTFQPTMIAGNPRLARIAISARVRANEGKRGEFFFASTVAPRDIRYIQ